MGSNSGHRTYVPGSGLVRHGPGQVRPGAGSAGRDGRISCSADRPGCAWGLGRYVGPEAVPDPAGTAAYPRWPVLLVALDARGRAGRDRVGAGQGHWWSGPNIRCKGAGRGACADACVTCAADGSRGFTQYTDHRGSETGVTPAPHRHGSRLVPFQVVTRTWTLAGPCLDASPAPGPRCRSRQAVHRPGFVRPARIRQGHSWTPGSRFRDLGPGVRGRPPPVGPWSPER